MKQIKYFTLEPNSVLDVALKMGWVLLKLVLVAFVASTIENPAMFVYAGF
ncbi:MAG: hypothetical protein HOG63_02090 [Nitrospina sp.]|jgi:hypothetical protein|nr:hypothetical protein [Nitrospina sp.]MBT4104275.1 hypothetical protein [Nitrospina sp.]MBT4390575.1 hypothetical protein [Nitrospina sp.]MBT4622116.1 hypothetical protein [Nitrospina sp.]MBT5261615.1 hypothetical protein [Nitrospina sp.]